MVGTWLGRKLLAPDTDKPPDGYRTSLKLAEIALSPLKIILEPFVAGAYYQKNIFKRFIQRALWSPVANSKYNFLGYFLAIGIPVVFVVLLAGSLVSLVAFTFIILGLIYLGTLLKDGAT
ncbi:unnamed protein product, partial [Symbiodinium necroappetens]